MPWVRPYTRADGTQVRGHSRWAPGARREMSLLAMFVAAVAVLGNGTPGPGTDSGADRLPRPKSTTVYPIRFPGTRSMPAPRPKPTVSYPIRWDRSSR